MSTPDYLTTPDILQPFLDTIEGMEGDLDSDGFLIGRVPFEGENFIEVDVFEDAFNFRLVNEEYEFLDNVSFDRSSDIQASYDVAKEQFALYLSEESS